MKQNNRVACAEVIYNVSTGEHMALKKQLQNIHRRPQGPEKELKMSTGGHMFRKKKLKMSTGGHMVRKKKLKMSTGGHIVRKRKLKMTTNGHMARKVLI
ncbi:hypothetical protein AVEN_76270-1 [Araneus ventricosus]|uniref:Uncharacterized protein n=1 Tax=Araneus ventricosus TaxID=182803 RepID=A0A4Y2I9P2_ARAVE|nr:hypothetical protein AVEN_76270-1 [Araneus ventricosus]